jgi:mono/diheme cytochrome c family protein
MNRADIAQYLKTGISVRDRISETMFDVVHNSTSHMTDADETAIATYLKSFSHLIPPRPAPDPTPRRCKKAGRSTHTCALCHEPHRSEPAIGSRLVGDTILLSRNPTTVLPIILQGSQSFVASGEPVTFSMPAFSALTVQRVADVATYIHNAWGNNASPALLKDVKAPRKSLIQSTR